MELIVRNPEGREVVISSALSVADILEDDRLAKLADGVFFAIAELEVPA